MTLRESSLQAVAAAVKLVVFDVDGVLTDGRLLLGPSGEEYKQFHVRDGHGIVMLRATGIAIGIISGRDAPVVARRMEELGVHYVYQGCRDKLAQLQELSARLSIELAAVCYVGDDLPDIAPMRAVGLPIAVADAHPLVADCALHITRAAGGFGAAREVAEVILAAQGTLAQFTTTATPN